MIVPPPTARFSSPSGAVFLPLERGAARPEPNDQSRFPGGDCLYPIGNRAEEKRGQGTGLAPSGLTSAPLRLAPLRSARRRGGWRLRHQLVRSRQNLRLLPEKWGRAKRVSHSPAERARGEAEARGGGRRHTPGRSLGEGVLASLPMSPGDWVPSLACAASAPFQLKVAVA